MSKWGFRTEIAFLVCAFLCWRKRTKKKKKTLNGKGKNIKIVFLRWSWKMRKMFFFSEIAWHDLCREGRKNAHFPAHYLFLAKILLWPNSETRKHYKTSGFSGSCPKPKMTPVFGKAFLGWEKKWFLLIVFLKSCSENTIFIVRAFSKARQLQ